jgi:hypothetical protein
MGEVRDLKVLQVPGEREDVEESGVEGGLALSFSPFLGLPSGQLVLSKEETEVQLVPCLVLNVLKLRLSSRRTSILAPSPSPELGSQLLISY